MTTFTVECYGFTGTALPSIAAVQTWIDALKAREDIKGQQVRIYRFVNGARKGGTPDRIGVIS